MNLPREIRYRAYSDWTKDEMDKIKDNVRFFIKIGHLELLMG